MSGQFDVPADLDGNQAKDPQRSVGRVEKFKSYGAKSCPNGTFRSIRCVWAKQARMDGQEILWSKSTPNDSSEVQGLPVNNQSRLHTCPMYCMARAEPNLPEDVQEMSD